MVCSFSHLFVIELIPYNFLLLCFFELLKPSFPFSICEVKVMERP
jgi:hypothetical protein